MIALRVALATAVLIMCAGISTAADLPNRAQNLIVVAAERDRPTASEREEKGRTPPPRPIVPPAGQQENPALRAECAWVGQRIVSLLFRDDPMTGNDFIPFYTRFGCPEAHLTQSFACVVKAGSLENEALADRIALCWTDPTQQPTVAKTGEAKPDESKPAEAKSDENKPDENKPEAAKSNGGQSGQGTGGGPVPENAGGGTQK